MKPVVVSLALIPAISILARNAFASLSVVVLILFFILFLAIYILSILVTRSFDNEDIVILLLIEKRLGIDAGPVKRLLKRFV